MAQEPAWSQAHRSARGLSLKTVVIEDSPQLKILATNELGEAIDATPAPVDKELFIRGQRHLFCIAE